MISFRPIADTDLDFLKLLYGSTRAEEMSAVPWPEGEKQRFIESQFEAQHSFYQQQFGNARFDLILEEEEPVGRLYLEERKDEFRIIDIALMPEKRGLGIGSGILKEIMHKASSDNKAVRIHVEKNNPALSLYSRLGFTEVEDQGVYLLMDWRPD